MVINARNAVIPAMGVALALQAGGCKKDDPSQTDLLVGEWEVVKINGAVPAPGYDYIFKFQADKDFDLCYQYNSGTQCYGGSWDWHDDNEDEVDMTWGDGSTTYLGNLEIDRLTKDEMEGTFITDGNTAAIELEKVK
jgi:hypothetical protein